jgi:hypothetical protein
MTKKNKLTKKTDKIQNPAPLIILILSVILVILMVTLITYSRERAAEASPTPPVSAPIVQEQNQIPDKIAETSEVKVVEEKKPETEVIDYPQTEIRFDKCAFFNSFSGEDWYQKFWDKAKELEFTPYSVSSACLSNNASMFIAIAQKGVACEGPQIYRFNTKSYKMEPATVIRKEKVCMGSLETFGKRAGDVIKVIGKSSANGCEYEDSFDYDFRQNTINLTKSRSVCGSEGVKTTTY